MTARDVSSLDVVDRNQVRDTLSRLRAPLEILILALLAALFVWRTFVPAWRSLNTDFPNYYVAARLYAGGESLTRVYDWIWFQRQKDRAGLENRVVVFIPHTLYSALPIVPLTVLPPLDAKRCWLVINLALLGFSGFLLNRMTSLGGVRIAILILLAINPLHTHFNYGQLHLVVLALLVLSLRLYLKNRPISCGVALAMAAAIKIYPILFAFYFIRKKQWRVVAGLAGSGLALAVLAILLFGSDVNRVYVEEVMPRIVRGEGFDPYDLNWNSFTALLYRSFVFEPELNPRPLLLNLPLGHAVLQPLIHCLLFIPLLWLLTPARASGDKEKLEYAAYIAALLLISTNPGSYHFVILIMCAVLAVDFFLVKRRIPQATLFVVFYALTCLASTRVDRAASGLEVLTASSRLVFLLCLYMVLLTVLSSLSAETWRERLRSRGALAFASMFALIVSVSASSNLRHIKSELNYAERVAPGTGSLLSSDPAVSEDRIVFTMLRQPTYVIGMVSGNQLSSFAAGADLFHPALVPGSSQALVELAGPASKIIRVDLNRPDPGGTFAVEVEDGEQPVVSSDGRWLAFIRQVEGRGSLWIKSLAAELPAEWPADWKLERRLAGPEYDVLDASFDGAGPDIIFAAQPRGRPELFMVGRASSTVTPFGAGSGSRYPAPSPDGTWMAYCRLQKGNWQIWLRPRTSGPERQLTTGECNSVSPAWMPDSKELVFATDCGRGLGMTALARMKIAP